jgi:succinoglycan biosynthesis protein ExoH
MPQHDISQRIAILRFIMIFGVVLLHTPLYVDIGSVGNDWFSLTKAFFQSAVFRSTTPVLAMISAYLLFNARLDTQLAKLARKKTRTG